MDQAPPDTARLREARLEQIEAIEAALFCAETTIAAIPDRNLAVRITQRVQRARAEAHALHGLFNIGV